jgi:EAP30/Vps36 family/Vacuolar protein sorting 36 NZF-N zinc-finger domain
MDLPPCLACGIKPPFPLVLKAAINAAASQSQDPRDQQWPSTSTTIDVAKSSQDSSHQIADADGKVDCPRCTFHNHPSLQNCELCGAPLPSPINTFAAGIMPALERPESPGPQLSSLNINDSTSLESVKFSFRAGGEKVFYERLKGAMIQRKWLLQGAPPVPHQLRMPSAQLSNSIPRAPIGLEVRPPSTPVGIAGLEQRGLQARRNNETVIGTAFEDLEALMASAKEIVALAEKFASESGSDNAPADSLLSESAAAMSMVATKDMLGEGSSSLYISELSRSLAEYVTDERRGILRAQGGIMSLVDLWAVFNRSRNGVELISPSDFHKAAQLWETLALPVRLRQFRSGLLVVQRYDWSDEKTLAQLKDWFLGLHQHPPPKAVSWDWEVFGIGVTAQDAAQRFGWSVGVATEELEMAEDRGMLCREEGVEGHRFWLNYVLISEETPI